MIMTDMAEYVLNAVPHAQPGIARRRSLMAHTSFAVGLYAAAWAVHLLIV